MNSASLTGASIQYCNVLVGSSRDEALVKTTLPDGSIVFYDQQDRMVCAQYSTGVDLLRREDAVFVNAADGSQWFGDGRNSWFRLN